MKVPEIKKVSVIVPIYKGNAYIPQLIHMLEENWITANKVGPVEIELVLVNDYPAEKLMVKKEWYEHISCIVIANKKNQGIHFSRVQGLLHSEGDYVHFLDQDDEISPVYFREQISAIADHDLMICNGKNRGNFIYKSKTELNRAVDLKRYQRTSNYIISPGQVLLRRGIIPEEWKSHILSENGADDYFLWILISQQDCRVGIQDKALYLHVNSTENTSNDHKKMIKSICEMTEKLVGLKYITPAEERHILEHGMSFLNAREVATEKYFQEWDYKRFLDAWMGLRDRKISVDKFLHKKGMKKIAIYGAGNFGRHLYYELQDSSIKVACFIDRNTEKEIFGLQSVAPGAEIGHVDAIIVTPFAEYEQIKKELEDFYTCEIISIQTIVLNADFELIGE